MSMQDFPQKKRRGVLICGAYGMGNAGDDAVLAAMVAALRRLDPARPITVMARRPAETARRFGVEAVHPLALPRWYAAMGRAALFLSGGGSLLQDITSRRSLMYYLTVIRLAHRRGCAVQLYGCGVGPLIRADSRRKTARVLNACADAVTLRDGGSAELLRDIGVTKPPVLLAADPALSLPPEAGAREPACGILLRPWPGLEARLPDIAACAEYIWREHNLTPALLCLAPEDRAPAEALAAALKARNVPCSIDGDARRVGRMSLVLSMRLHGLIFALRDGVPAAGLSYDPKVAAFCREAGLPCLPLEEASADGLRGLADNALRLDPEALARTAAALRERERRNPETAAALLAGGANNR